MVEAQVPRVPEVVRIGGERQLFIDDHLVAFREGVARFVERPEKDGANPILVMDRPWEMGRFLYCDLLFDREEGIYKLWYSVPGPGLCYATSGDGIRFERPNLGLVDFRGSKDNNLVSTPHGFAHDKAVIRDLRDPDPLRRYKMVHFVAKTHGAGVSFSGDGLTWSAYEGNPVIAPTGDGGQSVFWDERCGRYVLYMRPNGHHVKRWTGTADESAFPTRRIGRSESIDFEHWTDLEEVVVPDEVDGPGTEFYYMPVLRYEGCYIGFVIVFYHFTGDERPLEGFNFTLNVQLACSRDGRTWTRVGERQTFLAGDTGGWDEKRVYLDCALVEDDEIRLYYRGSNIPHIQISELMGTRRNGREMRGDELGLARLRLDGFASMTAGEREGTLTTRPLHFEGGSALRLNADARGGALRVEALTLYGEPVAGFTRDQCRVIEGDSQNHQVLWSGGGKLGEIAQPVRLRFSMRRAKLYSFQVVP